MRREGAEDRGSEELASNQRIYGATVILRTWGMGHGAQGRGHDGSWWWLWWVNSVVGLGDRYVLSTQ